jgi:CheY-like chemotaxis protein
MNPFRLLVVDDDEHIREALADILSDEGYAIETATQGQEALEHLRTNPPPNLILLDLMMPVMDGMRFMRTLAQEVPDPPPVVVLSALDKPEMRRDLLAAGARDVVRKPVELPVLLAALRSAAPTQG